MYSNNKTYLFVNGEFKLAKETGISPYTQSLHYGYAVFEGIRAYETAEGVHIFKAEAHFERLLRSAKLLHMNVNYNVEELINISYKLLKKNNLTNAYIRPLVFVGEQMTLRPSAVAHLMICTWRWAKYFGDETLKLKVSKYAKLSPKAIHVEVHIAGVAFVACADNTNLCFVHVGFCETDAVEHGLCGRLCFVLCDSSAVFVHWL